MKKKLVLLIMLCCLLCLPLLAADMESEEDKEFYLRGTFYQDWLGFKSGGSNFYNRLSSRLKLTLWNRPGEGWTAYVDIRDRFTLGGQNSLIIYDARLSFEKPESKLYFSIGQMNLYDTAGIGQLTGGLAGYRLKKYLSIGAYAGLEPDIYSLRWEFDYQKFGFFARYYGPGAKQFSLSYNMTRFGGETERQFLYIDTLFPWKEVLILYGNVEYEAGGNVENGDRLSRLFANLRVNPVEFADITAHYSSGRGLDYHRFLLEKSQDPTVGITDIERYYYNESYGIRFSIKPLHNLRLYAARRESEHKDRGVKNHTTSFGASATNILDTGVSCFAYLNLNRGSESESDSFYVSASRSFGRLTCSLSFANYHSGVITSQDGTPEVFYLTDHSTVCADFFLALSRALAVSAEYAYTHQAEFGEHQFYIRLVLRK